MAGEVRICVVGLGRAGMVHARNFAARIPGARLVAVVDEEERTRAEAMRELGVPHGFRSLEDALDHVEFDAVCVATPTFTHARLVCTAAAAGKHILCEKPIALTVDEALQMVRTAQRAGVVFQMGFMRRFDEDFLGARELIEAGAVGDVLIVRSTTRGPGLPPRWAWDATKGNGMLAEVNSHDFDTLRWLTGREFRCVFARAQARKALDVKAEFPDFYDVAVVAAEMEGGAFGLIEGVCPAGYGYDARIEVVGSAGVILVGSPARGQLVVIDGQGCITRRAFPSWRERFRYAYLREDEEFVAAVRGERAPRVTGVDGLRALEAVLAAVRSLTSGKPEPVERHEV